MGDSEQDENLACEIIKISSAKTKKSTVVEYRSLNRRASRLKIGLFVSLGLNVLFAALFVVVFIMLKDVNTKLARFDEFLNKENIRSSRITNRSGQNVQSVTRPTDTDYRSSTLAQERLVMFLLFYVEASDCQVLRVMYQSILLHSQYAEIPFVVLPLWKMFYFKDHNGNLSSLLCGWVGF